MDGKCYSSDVSEVKMGLLRIELRLMMAKNVTFLYSCHETLGELSLKMVDPFTYLFIFGGDVQHVSYGLLLGS